MVMLSVRPHQRRHHALHSAAGEAPYPSNLLQNLYKQRHRIENMFAKLKDWHRLALNYDRCAHTFFSAICIDATVILWLGKRVLTPRFRPGSGLKIR